MRESADNQYTFQSFILQSSLLPFFNNSLLTLTINYKKSLTLKNYYCFFPIRSVNATISVSYWRDRKKANVFCCKAISILLTAVMSPLKSNRKEKCKRKLINKINNKMETRKTNKKNWSTFLS